MRGFLKFLLLFVLSCCGTSAFAQVPGYTVNTFDGQYLYYSTPTGLQKQAVTPIYQSTTPSGSCSSLQLVINTTNNAISACINSSWTSVGSGQGTAPNQNVIYLSPNCGSQTNCYAIIPGGCATDASTTNLSPTVTSVSSLFLTTAHVGDIVWVMSSGVGGTGLCGDDFGATPQPSAKTLACNSTILSINSNTSLTLSANCTSTQTNAVIYFGTNNYTQFAAACSSAIRGSIISIASGVYVLDNHSIGSNPVCNTNLSLSIVGAGRNATILLTAPAYNHSFNFGSVFAITDTLNHSQLAHFSLDGTWTTQTQVTDAVLDVNNPQIDDVSFRGFSFGVNTEVFYTTAYLFGSYARDSEFEAGGSTSAFALNTGNNGFMDWTRTSLTAANGNVIEWEQASSGGLYTFTGDLIAGQNSGGGFQTLSGTSTSQADTIIFTNTAITQQANVNVINMAANFQFFNSKVQCLSCSGNSTALNLEGGTVKAQGSTFSGHGSGHDVTTASGTVFQEIVLPNTFSVGTNFAAGTFSSPFTRVAVGTEVACGASFQGFGALFSDSTTNTFGATIAGSGADAVGATCNGTNWTVSSL